MSGLVGNPEVRFSHVVAQLMLMLSPTAGLTETWQEKSKKKNEKKKKMKKKKKKKKKKK